MPYEYGVVKIKLRRDTAANLASVVLASGEPAFATDTNVLKIGNGSAAFSALSQIGGSGGGGGGGSSTFLGLSDSPSNFTSSANKLLAVNSSANAVVFVDNSGATALQSGDNISLLTNDAAYLTSVTNIDTTNFNAATIVTEGEGIGSNDNDTTLPTSAAVKDYVDNNAGGISSDTGVAGGGSVVSNIVSISASDYSGITPDSGTIYFIT